MAVKLSLAEAFLKVVFWKGRKPLVALKGIQGAPRRLNRSACGDFGTRCACRIACTSFHSRAMPTTSLRRATGRRSRSVRSSGTQTAGRKALAWSCARMDRVGLDPGTGDRLHLHRSATIARPT